MEKLTYRQAYDKIIEAYFRNEIEPGSNEFCFCGTLSKDDEWRFAKGNEYPYSRDEYLKMEHALFSGMSIALNTIVSCGISVFDFDDLKKKEKYEEALFFGMSSALEVLKDIHRSRGEKEDEATPEFTKRQLQKS